MMNTEIDASDHDEFQEHLEFLAEAVLADKETYRELYKVETLNFNERLNEALASDNLAWHEEVAESFMGDKPALDKLREWGLQFPDNFY